MWLSMVTRRVQANFQNKFLVTIRASDFAIFKLQKDLRVTQNSAAAITGYGNFLDFDSFGRFWHLRHSVFASQQSWP